MMPSKGTTGVTVGILTARRDDQLRMLLNSLLGQLGADDEILVLDTASTDSTRDLVEIEMGNRPVHYARSRFAEFQFARARNELQELAGGRNVAFIDDDNLPYPGWLERVRDNLKFAPVSGGPTVLCGPVPWWWTPEMNWVLGGSPPGTALSWPGYYPDTGNTSARGDIWADHPFQQEEKADLSRPPGREDAEWWMAVRTGGRRYVVDYRQAVLTHTQPSRLSLRYVFKRAFNDGRDSWMRRPLHERATGIPWDLMHEVGVLVDQVVKGRFRPSRWLPQAIWTIRQCGVFAEVWSHAPQTGGGRRELLYQLFKAASFQSRLRIGRAGFAMQHAVNSAATPLSQRPRTIFVSADCQLGDTVLLRPHIQQLAGAHPGSSIVVSAKFPLLLDGLGANVTVYPTAETERALHTAQTNVDLAVVPYYHYGSDPLWRKQLARVGRTFDCDVGFRGRRDYLLAHSLVEKNLELHEHENLARLFRLAPGAGELNPAPVLISSEAQEWQQNLPAGFQQGYLLIQLGAGYASKEWPVHCWQALVTQLCKSDEFPIIFIGDAMWSVAADEIVQSQISARKFLNLVGKTTVPQLLSLVKNARLLIGGCSGPKHIAYMYKVPTFTLYTATEPERWGATEDHELHGYVVALQQKLIGEELKGMADDHRPRLLKAEKVAEEVLRHLNNLSARG